MDPSDNIKCLTSYLRSLSVKEPLAGDFPEGVQLQEWNPKQSFAENIIIYRKRTKRCSDDFSHFQQVTKENLLPPVNLVVSEKYGRFLQASRNIEAGETIFWEAPLVLAPKGGSEPVCLGCFRALPAKNWPVCVRCKAPKCEGQCEGREHSAVECEMLNGAFHSEDISTDAKLVKKLNIILTPLRTHLAILECPSIEVVVWSLQSNALERSKSPIGEFVEKYVASFFQDNFQTDISSNFVHHVCGVFDTNAFDVTIERTRKARALLPLAALMNHSCIPNTQHWFYEGSFVLRASVPIRKGDPITSSYTQTLWCTKTRQNHLALTKLFSCDCSRCLDPSELGTHLSSIRCQKCKNDAGILVPSLALSKPWICTCCRDKFPSSSALNMIKVASNFVSRAELMDKEDLKKVLSKLSMTLGQQHYTFVQLHFLYVKKVIENLKTAKESELLEVLSSIHCLISITNKIEPGLTRLKGLMLLYKLRATIQLVSREPAQTSSREVMNLVKNEKFLQELDNEAEKCEAIMKWDAMVDDVQEARRQWTITKAEIQKLWY